MRTSPALKRATTVEIRRAPRSAGDSVTALIPRLKKHGHADCEHEYGWSHNYEDAREQPEPNPASLGRPRAIDIDASLISVPGRLPGWFSNSPIRVRSIVRRTVRVRPRLSPDISALAAPISDGPLSPFAVQMSR